MALPRMAAQQAGVDPLSVQQLQDQNQKISEILSKIEMRLSNVTNVRSNMQMATYDAFGNNFLSRGLIQITDSITDSIESLFRKPEKEKKDPIVEQLEQHTVLLHAIAEKSSGASVNLQDDIIHLRLDMKHIHELDHEDSKKQIEILTDIKRALLDRPMEADTPDKKASRKRRIKKLSSVYQSKDSDDGIDVVFEEEAVKVEQKQPEPPRTEPKKATTLLQRILEVLTKTSKDIEKSVNPHKISTQEETLESMQDASKVSDVEPGQRAPKGDRDSLLDRLFDKDLNILGFRRILRSLTGLFTKVLGLASPLLRVIPAAITAFGMVVSLIKKIPFGKLISSVASAAKSLLGIGNKGVDMPDGDGKPSAKTKPQPKGGGPSKLAKLGRGLAAAGIMTAGVMGVDAALGAAGVGGNEINEVQDDKNWERASTWEKVQSSVPRAIEHVGSFVGLDNIVNQARSERIKNETKYLDDKTAAIEQAQKDADKAKRLKEPANSKAPAVNFNASTTNNQTIIPMRPVVKNQDDSYNRYLNSVLK